MVQHDLPDKQAQHTAWRNRKRYGHAALRETLNLMEHPAAAHELTQKADGVLQCRVLRLVVIFGVEILDFSLREIQLRLRQFDNRGQAEIVTPLRKIQSEGRLTKKLRCNIDPLKGVVGACPGHSHVPLQLLLLLPQALVRLLRALGSSFVPGRKQMAVEHGYADVRGDPLVFSGDRG